MSHYLVDANVLLRRLDISNAQHTTAKNTVDTGQSCYIFVVATSDLFICQCHYDGYHPDKDKEGEIAKRALVQILDELIESQRFNRLVD